MKDVVRFLGIVFLVAAIATTMACGGGGGQGNNNDHPNYNPELPDAPGTGDTDGNYAKSGMSPWGPIIWDPGNECANFACWDEVVNSLGKWKLITEEECADNNCEDVLDHTDRVEGRFLAGLWDLWSTSSGTASQKGVHDPSTTQHANHPRLQGFTAFPCTNATDRQSGNWFADNELDKMH